MTPEVNKMKKPDCRITAANYRHHASDWGLLLFKSILSSTHYELCIPCELHSHFYQVYSALDPSLFSSRLYAGVLWAFISDLNQPSLSPELLKLTSLYNSLSEEKRTKNYTIHHRQLTSDSLKWRMFDISRPRSTRRTLDLHLMLKIKARTYYTRNSHVIFMQEGSIPSWQYWKTAYWQKFITNTT